MRPNTCCILLLASCLVLAALAGCKDSEPQAEPENKATSEQKEDKPQPPINPDPTNLDEAILLYENASSNRDLQKAVEKFNQYAHGNIPEAQYYYGLARWEGKGSQQSDLEAYVWWTIAARQHHLESMNRIEDAASRFSREDLDEINNRANDWEEHVRVTPEIL